MSRSPSFTMVASARTGCRKTPSHWLSKPAPPSPTDLLIQSLSPQSSAMLIFHGCVASIDSLIHCMSDQPSGRSTPASGTPRMYLVASSRSPSTRNSFSHIIALSWM